MLPGGHDEGNPPGRVVGPDPQEEIVAALVGHVPVADHEIERSVLLEPGNGLVAVAGLGHVFEAQGGKGLPFDFPHGCGVFHQQDLDA